jgi:hypothetical protein
MKRAGAELDPGPAQDLAARGLITAIHARHARRPTVFRCGGHWGLGGDGATPSTDGDATHHVGVYRAVVCDHSRPQEGDRIGVSRVQHPRVERPIIGGYGVRGTAFVDPRYLVSGCNGRIGRLEVEVFDRHRPRVLRRLPPIAYTSCCAPAAGTSITSTPTESVARYESLLMKTSLFRMAQSPQLGIRAVRRIGLHSRKKLRSIEHKKARAYQNQIHRREALANETLHGYLPTEHLTSESERLRHLASKDYLLAGSSFVVRRLFSNQQGAVIPSFRRRSEVDVCLP